MRALRYLIATNLDEIHEVATLKRFRELQEELKAEGIKITKTWTVLRDIDPKTREVVYPVHQLRAPKVSLKPKYQGKFGVA